MNYSGDGHIHSSNDSSVRFHQMFDYINILNDIEMIPAVKSVFIQTAEHL